MHANGVILGITGPQIAVPEGVMHLAFKNVPWEVKKVHTFHADRFSSLVTAYIKTIDVPYVIEGYYQWQKSITAALVITHPRCMISNNLLKILGNKGVQTFEFPLGLRGVVSL